MKNRLRDLALPLGIIGLMATENHDAPPKNLHDQVEIGFDLGEEGFSRASTVTNARERTFGDSGVLNVNTKFYQPVIDEGSDVNESLYTPKATFSDNSDTPNVNECKYLCVSEEPTETLDTVDCQVVLGQIEQTSLCALGTNDNILYTDEDSLIAWPN